MIENDLNFEFFGFNVSIQQELFWKTAKKLRIHTLVEMLVKGLF